MQIQPDAARHHPDPPTSTSPVSPADRGRRIFLTQVAGLATAAIGTGGHPPGPLAAWSPSPQSAGGAIPIIDTHIHLFDPTRPQGAPYTGHPDAGPPQPALPPRYRALASPLGIAGAIKVEASPWVEDNLWVLEVAERDTIVVGVIGNLEPARPDFGEMLARYHKNRLFRGIRYGNLWGRDITKEADSAPFIEGLRRLAQADLVLDTANPRVDLLEAIVKITDKVPGLRVVLDHLPSLEPNPQTMVESRAKASRCQSQAPSPKPQPLPNANSQTKPQPIGRLVLEDRVGSWSGS